MIKYQKKPNGLLIFRTKVGRFLTFLIVTMGNKHNRSFSTEDNSLSYILRFIVKIKMQLPEQQLCTYDFYYSRIFFYFYIHYKQMESKLTMHLNPSFVVMLFLYQTTWEVSTCFVVLNQLCLFLT